MVLADKLNEYDDKIKDAWAKLGFDQFLNLFKLAIPKNYPLRFFKPIKVLFLLPNKPTMK